MKFTHLTIRNYGAFHGDHRFDLADRGLVLILGDNQDEPRMNSNGSGKSTLLDALDWCLWGKIPRGDHADSVINEEAEKDVRVTVALVDEGGVVEITRTRGAPSNVPRLSIRRGDEVWEPLDVSQGQEEVERLLGTDREVFHATVLFAQDDTWNFADATDKGRMDLLTKILQLGDVDRLLESAKESASSVRKDVVEAEQEYARISAAADALRSQDPESRSREWVTAHAGKLQAARSALEIHSRNAPALDVAAVEAERQRLWEYLNSPGPEESFPLQEADRARAEAQKHAYLLKATAKEAAAAVTRAEAVPEGRCSQCGQEVTGEHRDREVARLRETAQMVLQDAVQAAEAASAASENARVLRASYVAAVAAENERRLTSRQRYQDLERELQTARGWETERQRLQVSLDMVAAEVDPYIQAVEETRRALADYQVRLDNLDEVLSDTRRRMALVDFWVEGFGQKGLKSYILDTRLQELTDAANEWVRLLTGGTVWVRFETQSKGRSTGKLTNKVTVRVFRYNPDGTTTERNYRSWSGGEKQRVSLGIDFGLSRLMSRRATKTYDLLVLDEVFKHLDRAGREAVVDLLHHLRREKSTVLVVDHDAEFQGAFENKVVVRKVGGRSTIHLEENHGEPTEERPRPRRTPVPARTPVR